MARIPSPLHDKSVPKRVSKPTVTAQAAATVAESAVAPARRARANRAAPASRKAAPAKTVVAGKRGAAASAPAAPAGKAKAAAKPKAPARAKAKAPAKPEAAAPAPAPKPPKAHKPKLVRDSFTIPKDEYAVLEALKARALGLGQHVRKSELLRAGIQALNAMDDRAFLAAAGAVPTLKTGRPKKG